ncbi:hypothetical protein SUGI_0127060 [Cryptomeria japonica]|uniref:ethylene-responsive transcription factor ERF018 n=1 Tax=Cryptomeria japonica TaxID=3369 RepID=UPI002408A520|nr:ethylene-responsive transcription factor ERF018 [Cryptomeria japonica]GLJ10374.1 hypothetical protein SUGI_0127060 [Cryptomeria japonica]
MDISDKLQGGNIAAPPEEKSSEKCCQYKGIRQRKWGKWVSEVRMPKCRTKIWLGSYDSAEQAARAYDAAVFCLRGPNAKFNFPNSIPAIPYASKLSRQEIQLAAAKYALDQIPSTSKSRSSLTEVAPSPSRSSSVSEMEGSSDGQLVSEEQEYALWESFFGDSGDNQCLNLEKLPSLDPAETLAIMSSSTTEEQSSVVFDFTNLWNF